MITVHDIKVGESNTFFRYRPGQTEIVAVTKTARRWTHVLGRFSHTLHYPTWEAANAARIASLRDLVSYWMERLDRAQKELDKP